MANSNNRIDETRAFLALLREGFIILIVLILFITPKTIKETLKQAGLKSVAGFELSEEAVKGIESETKLAGLEVSTLQDSLNELKARLAAVIEKVDEPETKNQLQSIQSSITSTEQNADRVDQNLKQSLYTQQRYLAQSPNYVKKETGWVYLGKVNQGKTEWASGHPKTVAGRDLPTDKEGLLALDALTIKTDTYLRSTRTAQESKRDVISVLREGDTVKPVGGIDYSSAKGGGWFVWLEVQKGL